MSLIKKNFFFSLLAICLVAYIFVSGDSTNGSLESSIEKLLPRDKHIQKIERMDGGFANDIWQIYTEDARYILREKTIKSKQTSFIKDLEIAKKASFYGIGPKVIGANIKRQQMLIEYIENSSWPTYEENSDPYKKAMRALKDFHQKMPSYSPFYKLPIYTPFEYIFRIGKKLEAEGNVPFHFSQALQKVMLIFEELRPWLKKNATLCHGDFCKNNVLLSKATIPILIDFDSSSIGDPFFDLVKFSLSLFPQQRQELFQEYLNGRVPTIEEQRHFELLDLTLLMLISTSRFYSAQNQENEGILSKKEMELLLESLETLPSFFEVPFADTSAKARQLGALYALAEFLKKSKCLTFS